eukprot:scaffold884_cov398-Prasinococcus_capsulatus_cf.AAC.24
MESLLNGSTFLCGDEPTLADVVCVCALLNVFKKVIDPAMREGLPATTRWFAACIEQPTVKEFLGNVVLCAKPASQKSSGGDKQVRLLH